MTIRECQVLAGHEPAELAHRSGACPAPTTVQLWVCVSLEGCKRANSDGGKTVLKRKLEQLVPTTT